MHRTATTMVAATVVLTLEAILVGNLGASRFAARQAAVASGAAALQVKLVIKEWDVPTPDSHPHDPSVAPDGALWYTGQMSNTLGRLDPQTGRIQEFRLTTPDSGPHGLVADRNGDIWFTANFKGYIGKLDPRTGKITEYPIADKGADDPHTPVFDQKGMLWFTVQQGNAVGRLDPRNGLIILKKVPTGHALPYGIAVNSKGVPFFCEFGTNKLAFAYPVVSASPNRLGSAFRSLPRERLREVGRTSYLFVVRGLTPGSEAE